MSYTPKKENVTKAELTGFGFTMKSGNENDYPIAYVHSIWDVIPSSGKASLVALLGATGQYSQEEINKAVADKLSELGTNVGKLQSAGKLVPAGSGDDVSFATVTALNANTSANVGDYAIVMAYVATEDTKAVDGKTYYADANGTALDSQPETGANIASAGYYEFVGFDRYHKATSNWVKDYRIPQSQFDADQWTQICVGNIDNTLMQKLSDLPTAAMLTALLATKQNVIDSSHKLDADLVDDEDGLHKFVTAQNKIDWNAKYDKPFGGIPSSDMTTEVQTSLAAADAAEPTANKETTIGNNPDNTKFPTSKAVKDYVDDAVSSNTATFRGSYENIASLPTSQDGLKKGDYAYVYDLSTSEEGNPSFLRYKYSDATTRSFDIGNDTYTRDPESDMMGGSGHDTPLYAWKHESTIIYTFSGVLEEGSYVFYDNQGQSGNQTIAEGSIVTGNGWLYEYRLNNSGYTASQWTAINSGIDADAAAWAKSEYEKNVMTKAYERYKLTQQYVSGSSIDVDNATGSVELAIRVKIEYKYGDTGTDSKDWVIVKALNHDALTTAGWERETTGTYAGWYKKTAENDSTITINNKVPTLTADTIAAQAFTYKPNQTDLDAVPTTQIPSDKRNTEFLGKTLSLNSAAKTTTMNWPYYYGWSTISGTTNMAALKESLTRVSKKSDVPTKQLSNGIVPGDTDVAMYFWVIRSTSGTCTMNQNNNTVSCVHPDYKGITVAVTNNNKELNYKAWRTNSFAGAATNIGEITITVS